MLMAEGRQKAEWGQTASIMALLANCHRDPKKRPRPFAPDEFMPRSRPRRKATVSVERLTDEIIRVGQSRGVIPKPSGTASASRRPDP